MQIEVNAKVYEEGKLTVMISKDAGMWHMSISHPGRYPTFDEIRDARYKYLPNEAMIAMLFPPKEQYINVHKNCFHLWEINENA